MSGVAVVVTLLFLILGIQENTEASRASNYGRTMGGMIQLRQTIISDPEMARIWNSYLEHRTIELDAVETTRLRQLVFMAFNIYEGAFYAREYGVLGESEWSRFSQQICGNWPRVVSAGFDEGFSTVLTPGFFLHRRLSGDWLLKHASNDKYWPSAGMAPKIFNSPEHDPKPDVRVLRSKPERTTGIDPNLPIT